MTHKTKRLERDAETAIVGGVLSGLAKYFDQDPVLFRVLAITFLIITGVFPGLLFYIVAMFMMPKRVEQKDEVEYEVVE